MAYGLWLWFHPGKGMLAMAVLIPLSSCLLLQKLPLRMMDPDFPCPCVLTGEVCWWEGKRGRPGAASVPHAPGPNSGASSSSMD